VPVSTDDEHLETLRTYEAHAERYVERTSFARSPLVDDLLRLTAPGADVLELGSGPGRDAAALEAAGLRVDRTDGTQAFVDLQRRAGHRARVLDVHADDFGGPFDAVFANAVLLHVGRDRLAGVLGVARAATRPGGVLTASFKKGSGAGWSTQKLDSLRHFTYWREDDLTAVLVAAGWSPISVTDTTAAHSAEQWITALARNAG